MSSCKILMFLVPFLKDPLTAIFDPNLRNVA
jgi:hypothetical protein